MFELYQREVGGVHFGNAGLLYKIAEGDTLESIQKLLVTILPCRMNKNGFLEPVMIYRRIRKGKYIELPLVALDCLRYTAGDVRDSYEPFYVENYTYRLFRIHAPMRRTIYDYFETSCDVQL